jgi:hypothetical protein
MDLTNKTALVWDYGLCVSLAERLGRDLKRVLYYSPWQKAIPELRLASIGSGLQDINVFRVEDPWGLLNTRDEPDVWIFPHLYQAGPQEHLRQIGRSVWGPGLGEMLETDRVFMKQQLEALGLPCPNYDVVQGIPALREYLAEHDGEVKHIKVSTFRGDTETFHFKTCASIEPKLDDLAYRLGAAQHLLTFLIEEDLPDAVEGGCDRFVINGQFISPCLIGYEKKNTAYVAKVVGSLPEPIAEVTDPFSTLLQKEGYTQFFSNEIRVIDKTFYVTDITTRYPSPPGEIHQEVWGNLPEVMVAGAMGQIARPIPRTQYAVQLCLFSDFARTHWLNVCFPEDVASYVKLFQFCRVNGDIYVIPDEQQSKEIGYAVGLGDTEKEAWGNALEVAKAVEGTDIEFDDGVFDDLTEEIKKGRKAGIEW